MTSPSERWASLVHLLRAQSAQIGERDLFRFQGTSATFTDVEERSNRFANILRRHGVERGDRVAVMLPNGIDFPTIWLTVLKLGAVTVSVNVQYRDHDLTYVLADSGAKWLVTDVAHLDIAQRVRPACPALQTIGVLGGGASGSGLVDLLADMEHASPNGQIDHLTCDRDDLTNLQYTSGTTGFPKGCMLTHGYWLELANRIMVYAGIRDDDIVLIAQPFYYMDPLWNTALCMMAGVPLVILPRFSASGFWRAVKENDVTFFYCLGTMPVLLLKQPPDPDVEQTHCVRLVLSSGIVPQLHETMERRWNCPWREAYGSTELGGVLAVPPDDGDSVGSGAVGVPMDGREVKLVDHHGYLVSDGDVGELLVRGRDTMLGYYGNPEATAQWMRDGWAHTGDLMSRDENGYYRMVGRVKDMIRRGGENIAAVEVEGVLCEHPAIRAAACVSVPDEDLGEEVKAFVQLQPGVTAESAPPQAIAEFVKGKLAAFKAPRYVEYVDDFPLTPSERIAKQKLVAQKDDQRRGAYDVKTETWR